MRSYNSFGFNNVCKEHSVIGFGPCPWPGCSQGISDDRFQSSILFEGRPHQVYVRKVWTSINGGNYYSWQDEAAPCWFSMPNVIANEVRRNGISTNSDINTDLIYHYTSLEGLMGIVNNRSIWLSDYSYLNDEREIRFGIDSFCEHARKMISLNEDANFNEVLKKLIENTRKFENRAYLASFSSNGDNLNLWRSYGLVAVGLNPHDLAIKVRDTRIGKVIYDTDVQAQLIQIHLNHMRQAYSTDHKEARYRSLYGNTHRILDLVAFFKNPSFASEDECRIVYFENPEVLKALYIEPHKVSFRANKTRIIPYIPTNALFPNEGDSDRELDIREIVLGPEADELMERGVKDFMISSGLPDVPIKRSIVPYRR